MTAVAFDADARPFQDAGSAAARERLVRAEPSYRRLIGVAAGVLVADAAVCGVVPLACSGFLGHGFLPHGPLYARLTLLVVVLSLAFIAASGGYGHSVFFSRGRQIRLVLRAAGAAMLVVAVCALALAGGGGDLWWAGSAAGAVLLVLAGSRAVVSWMVTRLGGEHLASRAVVLGSGMSGARLMHVLEQAGDRSLRVVGYVDDGTLAEDAGMFRARFLGPVSEVFSLIRRGLVDQVIVALPWSAEERILGLLRDLSGYPVHVRLAPDLISYHFQRKVRVSPHGLPMIHLADRPISGWERVVKRAEDVIIAGVFMLVAAIPMAVIALLVKLDSPGPVLFRQNRAGFNGRTFQVLKFRTMYHHMADHEVRRQTTRDDPRVTRVGSILRRTSLDEIPQILNVLIGDMSVVGPRPHAPGTRAGARLFEQVVDGYAARHRVKPGLTGLAQVRGFRGETKTEDMLVRRVESDLEYIERWSLWLDLVILLRTAVVVFQMKNAY